VIPSGILGYHLIFITGLLQKHIMIRQEGSSELFMIKVSSMKKKPNSTLMKKPVSF
jgi:hypothetical protein